MSITFPLCSGWSEHFGTGTSGTTFNVGTGSNRKAFALVGYTGNTSPSPTGFTVGSDTLSLVGSVVTVATLATKWALYQGSLTQTGTQTCQGTWSGTFGAGFNVFVLLVAQGGAALTFANALAALEQSSGSAGNNARTVTSASGDVVVLMELETSFSATPTAHSPATLITGSAAPNWVAQQAASAGSTAIQTDWSTGYDLVSVGFTLTEAGGGGGGGLKTRKLLLGVGA